jgi:two-component system cell cycle response regulator DivK
VARRLKEPAPGHYEVITIETHPFAARRWSALRERNKRGIVMSKCILVVEDEKDNRQILRDLLGNAGYELTEAQNGEEAIAAVAKRRPNLILMDIQLPIIDGYEATRRIRTNPDLRSVPIIAVTSCALAGDKDKALAAGCDGYVSKPYSPRDLLAKVRTYLVD